MSAAVRLAVLGAPLRHSRSPDLHRAGLAALGLECVSEALVTPPAELAARLASLAAAGCRGVNLTAPLKAAVIPHLAHLDDDARRARSVNTVGFDPDGWWGATTDGIGFVALLESLGRDPGTQRVVLLGAGGAARSLALALGARGATLAVSARDSAAARAAWAELPEPAWLDWGSRDARRALDNATLVVQATPLDDASALPDPARLPASALLVDLVYGEAPTAWVRAARAAGREAYDGLGLLVFQACESLARWTGRAVPVAPLARAVGWPR